MSRATMKSINAGGTPAVAPLRPSHWAWILLAAAVALGAGMPSLVGSVLVLTLLTQAVTGGILAVGVGFLIRQNGVVSFGHAAWYGVSAYCVGLLMRHDLVPGEIAVLLALAVPTVIAFLLGLVIVRVPGVAFSMLTLAIGQAFHEFAMKAQAVTNGDDGFAIPLPETLFGLPISYVQQPEAMFVLCWCLLVLTIFGLHAVVRSPFGRLTEAIRENEERARFIGYKTVLPRAATYAISAFVASLAGLLFALYNGFVSPEVLHWSLSGSALIMAVIGGAKRLWGPALGAVIFFFLKDLAGNLTEHWPAMIGVTVIVVTVTMPGGIAGSLGEVAERLRPGRKTAGRNTGDAR